MSEYFELSQLDTVTNILISLYIITGNTFKLIKHFVANNFNHTDIAIKNVNNILQYFPLLFSLQKCYII